MLFSKSRLNWREEERDTPNLVLIPDIEGDRADILQYRIKPRLVSGYRGDILQYRIKPRLVSGYIGDILQYRINPR